MLLEYIYLEKAGILVPRYIVESEDRQPDYRNLAGQKITPTQIISLLTQNPGKVSESRTYEVTTSQDRSGQHIKFTGGGKQMKVITNEPPITTCFFF
jgi:hypothetical protein